MKIKKISLFVLMILVLTLFTNFAFAQDLTTNVCCEKTTYGAFCQNAPAEQCDANFRSVPTSCEATSFCKEGCCYDSDEGICMESTSKVVCEQEGGVWNEDEKCNIPQCNEGCCILGNQAAYVNLVRCKKLSNFYGLQTDFRTSVNSEQQCIALAQASDEGACVYEREYEITCKSTTRQGCNEITSSGGLTNVTVTFYKDYLCSHPDLGTDCGPSSETTCVDGKDEVYFVDTCGNPANIYDAQKKDDIEYWKKSVDKQDSCNSNSDNSDSKTCGNCDYYLGSICAGYDRGKDKSRPTYGDNICRNLDCEETSDGEKKHGESWCSADKFQDSVGSRYFRHLCVFGEEIVEPCADFRQEICIEDEIETSEGAYSQGACRVNRWQDCYSQIEKDDCENKDRRDCKWILDKDEVETRQTESETKINNGPAIATSQSSPTEVGCVPEHPPGFDFWNEGEAEGICSLANIQCHVIFEDKLLGGGGCVDNCECMEQSWENEQITKCSSLGDCGARTNWVGRKGSDDGYKITRDDVKSPEDDDKFLGII